MKRIGGAALMLPLVVIAASCAQAPSKQGPAPDAEIDAMTARNGDRDVFPSAFHGRWAADAATCRDPDGKGVATITAGRVTGYESDAVLLKIAVMFEQSPDGKEADTLLALVAQSGEGELGIERMRLSRSGDHLHLSREPVAPAQHWAQPLIRCS